MILKTKHSAYFTRYYSCQELREGGMVGTFMRHTIIAKGGGGDPTPHRDISQLGDTTQQIRI